MAYRNKTYVGFDGDNDIRYYRLMTAWKENNSIAFNFYDAHDANNIMPWSNEDTIKRRLRERFKDTKVFVILIGNSTKNLYKYVRWEIEYAIKQKLPIIAVNLNNSRSGDDLCPPILRNELAMFVPFKQKIIDYALNNWPTQHNNEVKAENIDNFYYPDEVYKSLGL